MAYLSGIIVVIFDSNFLKYLIVCLGSCISGISAGFLWISQGRYIHLACEKYHALDRKGEMYGIFGAFYCLSNVTAGLITTFGLGFFDAEHYFVIVTLLGVIATFYCLFFVRNISEKHHRQ
jgi:MFS family permease